MSWTASSQLGRIQGGIVIQAGIDLENRTQIMTTFTRDHHEQVTAFLKKRPPHYTSE